MDGPTVAIYERVAREWTAARGDPIDDLAARFRHQAGEGLVADLGCGPGRYLTQMDAPAIGVDVTMAMLELAAQRGFPLVRGDLEALPVATGALVAAFGRHSYLHLPKARMSAALAELRRVLRPGGLAMLLLIEGDQEGPSPPGTGFPGRYFSFWSPEEIRALMSRAGFAQSAVERIPWPDGGTDLLVTARR